jgi:hypothetical protein
MGRKYRPYTFREWRGRQFIKCTDGSGIIQVVLHTDVDAREIVFAPDEYSLMTLVRSAFEAGRDAEAYDRRRPRKAKGARHVEG